MARTLWALRGPSTCPLSTERQVMDEEEGEERQGGSGWVRRERMRVCRREREDEGVQERGSRVGRRERGERVGRREREGGGGSRMGRRERERIESG